MIELGDIEAAAERLDGVAHETPVVTSRTLDAAVGAAILLKAENLQRGGAFKFRGAYNKIAPFGRGAARRRRHVLVREPCPGGGDRGGACSARGRRS